MTKRKDDTRPDDHPVGQHHATSNCRGLRVPTLIPTAIGTIDSVRTKDEFRLRHRLRRTKVSPAFAKAMADEGGNG